MRARRRGADLEELGETVRARVKATSGVELEWEIKRLGVPEMSSAGLLLSVSLRAKAGNPVTTAR